MRGTDRRRAETEVEVLCRVEVVNVALRMFSLKFGVRNECAGARVDKALLLL
jgi:hypothetical protein